MVKKQSGNILRTVQINKRSFLRILRKLIFFPTLILLLGPFLVKVPPLKDIVTAEQLTVLDSQFNEIAGLTVLVKTMRQAEPVFVLLY